MDNPWNGLVNYEAGLQRFGNNQALFEKLLLSFLSDPTYKELDVALKALDYKAAFGAAHTLKGVAGNLSLQPLFEACNLLVEELREEHYPPRPVLFESVQLQYEITIHQVQKLMQKKETPIIPCKA